MLLLLFKAFGRFQSIYELNAQCAHYTLYASIKNRNNNENCKNYILMCDLASIVRQSSMTIVYCTLYSIVTMT